MYNNLKEIEEYSKYLTSHLNSTFDFFFHIDLGIQLQLRNKSI